MLRISLVESSGKKVVLRLDGDLSEREVTVLEHEGDKWRRITENLVLDIQELRHIDEAGIALLQRWADQNVSLQRVSPFLRELLEKYGIIVKGI